MRGTGWALMVGWLGLQIGGWAEPSTLLVSPQGPWRSLEEALAQAQAGDTIRVQGGVYLGPLVVRKSVRLLGEGWPVVDGGGRGTVVRLEAPGIVFRGFVVRGSGETLAREEAGILVAAPQVVVEGNRLEDVLFGIILKHAPKALVRGNILRSQALPLPRRGDLIKVWYSDGVTLEGNRAMEGRDVVLWFSRGLQVMGNEVRRGRYGLHFMYCDEAVIEGNFLAENSVGAYLMYSSRLRLRRNLLVGNRGPSGYGVGLKDMRDYEVVENLIADNRAGLFMDNALGRLRGNLIAFNDAGLLLLPSSRGNKVVDNSFVENGEQVVAEGYSLPGSNLWRGNHWSDYNGYDADGDGFGDIPYRALRFLEGLTERNPLLRLFAGSPSVQALDTAARLFPVFAPQPKFTDSAPRIRPLPLPLRLPSPPRSPQWIWASALMLGGAWGLLWGLALLAAGHRPRKGKPSWEGEILLEVRHLRKRFGSKTAVEGVDFQVARGEAVALWGPNGAGKTTVLRCILGMFPFEGTVRVAGYDARREGKELRRLVGYVPQEVRLHPDLSVEETMRFYARLRREAPERVEALLQEWQLVEVAHQAVGTLSGGMRQRVALAIALLSDPPLLLLDEPTSNLDAQTRREVWGLLRRLKEAGKTLLFCSHRTEEVFQIADRVIVLEEGRQVAQGKPSALREHLPGPILHLFLPSEARERAILLLQERGFAASPNGSKVSVPVLPHRKMEPLQVLLEASIPLLDFDIVEEGGEG